MNVPCCSRRWSLGWGQRCERSKPLKRDSVANINLIAFCTPKFVPNWSPPTQNSKTHAICLTTLISNASHIDKESNNIDSKTKFEIDVMLWLIFDKLLIKCEAIMESNLHNLETLELPKRTFGF